MRAYICWRSRWGLVRCRSCPRSCRCSGVSAWVAHIRSMAGRVVLQRRVIGPPVLALAAFAHRLRFHEPYQILAVQLRDLCHLVQRTAPFLAVCLHTAVNHCRLGICRTCTLRPLGDKSTVLASGAPPRTGGGGRCELGLKLSAERMPCKARACQPLCTRRRSIAGGSIPGGVPVRQASRMPRIIPPCSQPGAARWRRISTDRHTLPNSREGCRFSPAMV
jgi:hypothetical protein